MALRNWQSCVVLLFGVMTASALAQQLDDPCQPKLEASKKVAAEQQEMLARAKTSADRQFEEDSRDANICLEGTISMVDNHWALHVPEFVMKEQRWVFDIPKIEVNQRDMIFHTPSATCDTGVVFHQPVTVCEPYKPFEKPIPQCKVEMRPVVGRRCHTFMQEQRVRMGVPEVYSQKVEWFLKIPEVTMKRHDWYFKLPKFNPTAGCLGGSDCERRCRGKLDAASTNYQNRIGPQSVTMRLAVAGSTHEVNMCYRDLMTSRRDLAAAQYDAGVSQLTASIASLTVSQASADIIAQLRRDRDRMMKEREDLVAQMSKAIADIEEADKKMMEEVSK